MTEEFYGHVSKNHISGKHKTTLTGYRLVCMVMIPTIFKEKFDYAGYTFYIAQTGKETWTVVEKYTGLSACNHGSTYLWKTKDMAVKKAMENIKKYEAEGNLQEKIKAGYLAWLHTRTSIEILNATKLKLLKKL